MSYYAVSFDFERNLNKLNLKDNHGTDGKENVEDRRPDVDDSIR